tara:strand:+ start:602 stop:898 length:297 start_codon:yes stop_codon:yes gene_type:complete
MYKNYPPEMEPPHLTTKEEVQEMLDDMAHRMTEIKPPHYTTEEQVQEMIDDAIRKHNRNAGIISMCVGWVVLALFAEGLLRLIGVVPPLFDWLNLSIQ